MQHIKSNVSKPFEPNQTYLKSQMAYIHVYNFTSNFNSSPIIKPFINLTSFTSYRSIYSRIVMQHASNHPNLL